MPKNSANTSAIAQLMRSLDLCMLTTRAAGDSLHTRPMSNNGEVAFDGDVWFFSSADTRKVREIESDPRVMLTYSATERGVWLALEGRASIVRDPGKKRALWLAELEQWFDEEPEDDSIVLIHVEAERAERWGAGGEGVLDLR